VNFVIDASAVLALLYNEAGADRVAGIIRGSTICSINLAEVGTRLLDLGGTTENAQRALSLLGLAVADFDDELAWRSVDLRESTRAVGLSLGDRACLALAIRESAVALTADRAWAQLNIDCEIELIR
jgi:ribonuclease VapC